MFETFWRLPRLGGRALGPAEIPAFAGMTVMG
jgi:hypothetical protein